MTPVLFFFQVVPAFHSQGVSWEPHIQFAHSDLPSPLEFFRLPALVSGHLVSPWHETLGARLTASWPPASPPPGRPVPTAPRRLQGRPLSPPLAPHTRQFLLCASVLFPSYSSPAKTKEEKAWINKCRPDFSHLCPGQNLVRPVGYVWLVIFSKGCLEKKKKGAYVTEMVCSLQSLKYLHSGS